MNVGKFGEIGNFDNLEKFSPDGQYAYLFHEEVYAKALSFILNISLTSAYRSLKDAKVILDKPSDYKLTLGEFCTVNTMQRPQWFAYRFLKYLEGE